MAVIAGRRGSPFAVSIVMAAYFFGEIVFAPFWGTIAEQTGRRRLILAAPSGLGTLAIVPLAFVKGAWMAIGFRTR